MVDWATDEGRLADERLRRDEIIWLITVNAKGQPQTAPVWFLWDGATILIYSQPNKAKLRNIQRNPRVALNLNSDADGNGVVRMEGRAEIDQTAGPATSVPEMIEKYREGIARIGAAPESFAKEYSVAIRVTPTKLTAF